MNRQRSMYAVVFVVLCATVAWGQPPAKPKTRPGEAKGATASQPKAAAGKLGTPADEAAVRALVEQYQQAFNSNDPAKAVDVYAEHAVFVDETGRTLEGKPEIAKALTGGGSAANRVHLALTVEAVRFIKPDVALMRGRSTATGGDVPAGGGSGHWAVVAMKMAGQWKVVAAQAAVDMPTQGREP
jgi:uncharacterized protein (TIGR02246 family)